MLKAKLTTCDNSLEKENGKVISKNVNKKLNMNHMKIRIPFNYKKIKTYLLDEDDELSIPVNVSNYFSPKIQHFEENKI
tara:strand:- start:2984 stop:3220 length:237 start_codon:yes stop_codon:yes gene_type:complete